MLARTVGMGAHVTVLNLALKPRSRPLKSKAELLLLFWVSKNGHIGAHSDRSKISIETS